MNRLRDIGQYAVELERIDTLPMEARTLVSRLIDTLQEEVDYIEKNVQLQSRNTQPANVIDISVSGTFVKFNTPISTDRYGVMVISCVNKTDSTQTIGVEITGKTPKGFNAKPFNYDARMEYGIILYDS